MPNMGSIIKQHNNKILTSDGIPSNPGCNCRLGTFLCPLKGKCLVKDVVYEATIVTDNDTKFYIGSCATTFKARYSNHISNFKNAWSKNATELSGYIWELKEQNRQYKINWKILKYANSYKNGQKNCKLCLTEKMAILKHKPDWKNLVNKIDSLTK